MFLANEVWRICLIWNGLNSRNYVCHQTWDPKLEGSTPVIIFANRRVPFSFSTLIQSNIWHKYQVIRSLSIKCTWLVSSSSFARADCEGRLYSSVVASIWLCSKNFPNSGEAIFDKFYLSSGMFTCRPRNIFFVNMRLSIEQIFSCFRFRLFCRSASFWSNEA